MLRLFGSVIVVAAWVGVALGAAYLVSPDGEQLAATAPAGDDSESAAPVDAEAEAGVASFALIPEPESALLAPLAVPEPEPHKLPPVLSDADAALYKEIFEVQAKAEWQVADYLVAKLEDKRLMGYVLAQRYLHPTGYRSRYEELRVWLASYAELPEAGKIYKLALQRRPKGAVLPSRPVVARTSIAAFAPFTRPPYKSTKRLTRAQRSRVRQLQGRIRRHLGRTELTVTEELLEDPEIQRLFDQVQLDDAYASVAAGWLYYGDYEKANKLVAEAARRSGDEVPLAHWTAGLAAWRLGEFARAADHFEAYARSDELSGWTAAAGAYWSARAHWQLGDRTQVKYWLIEAARFPRTFYGLLARQRLGQSANFDLRPWRMDAALLAPLQATVAGGRALAFLQLGDSKRAEKELMAVERWDDPAVAKGILAVAEAAQLPALSYRLASRLSRGRYPGWAPGELDRALYPVPPWRPQGGFVVDRALVYAVMRQESQFKLWAKSREGARGLMQLLPSTASFVAKGRRFTGRAVYDLYDPALNIGLGQRYLAQLLKHPRVEGDLFRLAVAYNGGPGNLGKWRRRIDDDDPLLFIESLPTLETRLFIERVLTNLWIYRARLGQPAPSLAAIASGAWPSYQALDGAAPRQAASGQEQPRALADQDVY
jgi:soluble lytic murein transglycosylase-like protein